MAMSAHPVIELADLRRKEHKNLEDLLSDILRTAEDFEAEKRKARLTREILRYHLTPADYRLLNEDLQLRVTIYSGGTPAIGGYKILEDATIGVSKIEYSVSPMPPKTRRELRLVETSHSGSYSRNVIGTPRGKGPYIY